MSATPKNFEVKKLDALKLPKDKFLKLMKESVSPKKLKKLNLQYHHKGSPKLDKLSSVTESTVSPGQRFIDFAELMDLEFL